MLIDVFLPCVASNAGQKNTDRHKRNYDLKVREDLDVGDRVLVRRVGFRVRHKIADRWENTSYVVKEIPIKDVPVFKLQFIFMKHNLI